MGASNKIKALATTLYGRILSITLGAVILVSLTLTGLYLVVTFQTLISHIDSKSLLTLTKMKKILAVPLLTNNYVLIVDIIDEEVKTSDLHYIWVTDKNDNVIACNDEDQIMQKIQPVYLNNPNYIEEPLPQGGTISILPNYSIVYSIGATVGVGALISCLALIFAVSYLTIRLSHKLSDPIRAVVDASSRMAVGKFEINLPRSSILEIDQLTVSLMDSGHKLKELTENLSAEKELLRGSEEKYRNIFEHAAEGIFQLDPDKKLTTANPALARILGYKKVSDILKEDSLIIERLYLDVERGRVFAQDMSEKELMEDYDFKSRKQNGEYIFLELIVSSVRDAKNNVIFYEGTLNDITHRKRVEESELARKHAESANKAKSEFLANMSHEIRTPLNAILGFTEILKNEIQDPRQQHYLSSVDSSGKSLLRLINDILDLSRVESGKLELEYLTVEPRKVFNEVYDIFAQTIESKGLEYRKKIDPNLPELLFMDEIRLRQILFNLMGNAVKFTEKGHISFQVQCKVDPFGKSCDLTLIIADSGIGIPEQELTWIFDAFTQQSGQNSSKYGGSGLGLAITRRLIEMLNGVIEVESVSGKGSTFRILLPELTILDPADEKARDSELTPDEMEFDQARVLVVDDKLYNRELICSYLEHTDLQILEARDGQEALNKAREHLPDIILMDNKMPVLDGRSATEIIKSDLDLQSIPVIIVTASAMKDERAALKEICDGLINKPFSRTELFQELARFLGHNHKELTEAPVEAGPLILDESKKKDMQRLLKKLNDEYKPHWEYIKHSMIINDIEEFAINVKSLSMAYSYLPLNEWAEKLRNAADNFRMDELPDLINQFNDFLSQLESISSDTSVK